MGESNHPRSKRNSRGKRRAPGVSRKKSQGFSTRPVFYPAEGRSFPSTNPLKPEIMKTKIAAIATSVFAVATLATTTFAAAPAKAAAADCCEAGAACCDSGPCCTK
jgi:hypothetical protein